MRWFLAVASFVLFACGPKPVTLPPTYQQIENYTTQAWYDSAQPNPGKCLLGTELRFASSIEEFERECEATIGVEPSNAGPTIAFDVAHAAACVAYRSENRGVVTNAIPYVLLRPGQELFDTENGSVASHEWIHILYSCTKGENQLDRFDGNHKDVTIWTGPNSTHGRARRYILQWRGLR